MGHRKPIIREAHLEQIAARYLKGETQTAIAAAIGLTQQTVSNDLKTLQKRWQQSALIAIDERKGEELARIDQLEREYWQAWERSQQPTETQSTRMVTGGILTGERNEASLRREGQTGDPRYLTGVQWCIEQRVKILGLAAPIKQDVTSNGKPIERMDSDELIAFITQRIAGAGTGG